MNIQYSITNVGIRKFQIRIDLNIDYSVLGIVHLKC